jgi:anti-sigma B factor antagonist
MVSLFRGLRRWRIDVCGLAFVAAAQPNGDLWKCNFDSFIVSGMSAEQLTLESVPGQAVGSRVLRLTGPLTISSVFEFQSTLRADPPPALILDLTEVPYMDSAGMGAIINYYVACQRAGRKVIVAGVNGRVLELFKMTKVDALLTMVNTVADAERSLG